jgi:hypothetical protein
MPVKLLIDNDSCKKIHPIKAVNMGERLITNCAVREPMMV